MLGISSSLEKAKIVFGKKRNLTLFSVRSSPGVCQWIQPTKKTFTFTVGSYGYVFKICTRQQSKVKLAHRWHVLTFRARLTAMGRNSTCKYPQWGYTFKKKRKEKNKK